MNLSEKHTAEFEPDGDLRIEWKAHGLSQRIYLKPAAQRMLFKMLFEKFQDLVMEPREKKPNP